MENISLALFLGVRLTLRTYGENASDYNLKYGPDITFTCWLNYV